MEDPGIGRPVRNDVDMQKVFARVFGDDFEVLEKIVGPFIFIAPSIPPGPHFQTADPISDRTTVPCSVLE